MSEAEEKFDAIIVGAGPAGTACAYLLAKNGKSVLLIERGVAVGSKNIIGGRLYTYALELVEPGLYLEAPLERKVVHEQIMLLGSTNATTIDYYDASFKQEVPQSYTLLRASFDEWFAGKAEEQGAMLAAGIKVDDLLMRDGKVIGVKAGDDELYADIVIAADGVNSIMAQKAGLQKEITPSMVGVGVKEVIELPAKTIQERFQLADDEGTARAILGCTEGITGGGFLYTNKDSISLGVVFSPERAGHSKNIQEIYQDFKMNPAIYSLIGDGNSVEYGAHLVPEGGWNSVPPKLYRDGMLIAGDAAGFCINGGTILRGMDLAILSGVAAARAVLGGGAANVLGPRYVEELTKIQLIPTMKVFAGWPNIISLPRMPEVYPAMVNDMMNFMFTVNGQVPEKMPKAMRQIIKKHVTVTQLLADGWKGVRSL